MKFPGLDLLVYLGDGASSETFSRVAGQRTTSFSVNQEVIDVTDKDDSRWKKLLEGGVRSMSISMAGLIEDVASHKEMLEIMNTGVIRNFRVQFADGQSFQGPMQMTAFEGSGEYTDAQLYSITLDSAGDMAYEVST